MFNRHSNYDSKAIKALAILALIWLPLVSGCGPTTGTAPTEIKIGVVYPLSGSSAATGTDLQRGIELAAEIINGQYDLDLPLARTAGLPNLGGAKIKVVFGDHAGDPQRGVTETKRLLDSEKVVALIGAYNSSVTAQASQVAETAGVPFLNADSTSPALTARSFQWFFRTTADDSIFARNFFDFLADLQTRRNITPGPIAIVYENSLFGSGVAQQEHQYAQKAGLTVAADVPYSAKATSVMTEVQQIISSGATLVMQSSYDNDAILYMQTYKSQGYLPQAILAMDAGFISPSFVKALGQDANDALSRDVWALDLGNKRPLIKKVNDLFQQRYGTNMTGNSARAFTGLIVLADAINRAKSTDPRAVRQALLETNMSADQIIMPWEGVKFDPANGQNTLARGIIVQIQDGAYHTVWPWDVATSDLVWPMRAWNGRNGN